MIHVTLIAAQSLDGFITRHDEPGTGFTSEADRRWFASVLPRFDCTVLGAKTYAAARDFLRGRLTPERLRVVRTRDPARWAADVVPGMLEFSDAPPDELLAGLEARGRHRCALLGGSEAHAAFVAAGRVDAWWITIEPRVFGAGRPLCPGPVDVQLRLVGTEELGDGAVLLRYERRD